MVGGVLVLAGAQCLYWLAGSLIAYALRNLFAPDSAVVAERTRGAVLLLAWFVVNAVVLVLYARRTGGWRRVAMGGLQVANLAYGLWLGITTLSSSCFQDTSIGILTQPAGAGIVLMLLYADWRRFGSHASAVASPWYLVTAIGLLLVGLTAVLYAWRLGVQDIEVHSGTVIAVVDDPYGSTITLDSLARPMYFDRDFFLGLPPIAEAQHLTVLTSDSPSCGYGAPVAIEVSGITYVDQLYGGDVGGFRPETWWIHEAIRWTVLTGGFALVGLGLMLLLRWIG